MKNARSLDPGLGHAPSNDICLGGQEGILHLVELLRHEEAAIREKALFLLAEAGDKRAAQRLLYILDNRNNHPRRRARAAQALGTIHSEQVILALLERLGEPYWYVRWQITLALGRLGDRRAVPPLLDILKEDLSSFARQNAAIALGQLRCPSAISQLIIALDDNKVIVREAAVAALLNIGTAPAQDAVKHYREQQGAYETL